MNILGFNPSHHSSVCLLQNGEIKYFIEEERLTRKKYTDLPFIGFIDILKNYKIDWITWGTPGLIFHSSQYDKKPYWVKLAKKYHPNIKFWDFTEEYHHEVHRAHSFFNSGFNKSICVIIDGIGSSQYNKKGKNIGVETESIFYCSYPNTTKLIYKNILKPFEEINLSRVYETITMHLGWDRNEAGKTMGLSSYGKSNLNIPPLFKGNLANLDIFYTDTKKFSPYLQGLTPQTFLNLDLEKDPRSWHYDKSKITDLEKDLAWKVQNDTQQIVGDYIEKAIKETGLKQVCCAGGYFLNCVTNYYLLKRFPNVEFYFEPIANDAGTAIGAAKLLWHELSQDTTKRLQKSLYYGPKYSKKQLLEGIQKYVSN